MSRPKRRFWRRSSSSLPEQRRQNPAGDEFETRTVHAGQEPDAATGAVVPPITLASTFVQDAVGDHRGYEYARSANPTRAALETCVAELEGAEHGLAFASGMAAEDAILRAALDAGDHVIIPADAYGGTYRIVAGVFEPAGITWTAVDLADVDALTGAWRDETKLLWVETPTNPLLTVVDIAAVAGLARERGALVVVDNTFATTCSSHSASAPTSWCTRARSTSAATPTSSVAWSRCATASSRGGSRSSRTRRARCRVRSTATSCCAA